MLSTEEYIRMSLELDLFFLRIMKEHSFFLAAAFTPKNPNLFQTADSFARQFSALLQEAVGLANGVLPADALYAGQFYTIYTHNAEQASAFFTGIGIDSTITEREEAMQPGMAIPPGLKDRVSDLNRRTLTAVTALATFKSGLLADVLSCRLFMNTYSLLIDHILREAEHFKQELTMLQNGTNTRTAQELAEQEAFWNRIMAEHSKFIRGLLDPTEVKLFDTANDFGKEFDALTEEAKQAQDNITLLPKATADSLQGAYSISGFNATATEGILHCQIRSIILPLLGDHVLREANHFIFILKQGSEPMPR